MTIYSILKDSGVSFTEDDANNIGMAVRRHYVPKQPPYSKTEIVETYNSKSKQVWVRDYPNECRETIEEVIVNYFSQSSLNLK